MTPFLWSMCRCEFGAAAAAAVVWVVARAAGRRLPPRWRYALWLCVLGRLCLPVLPGIPVRVQVRGPSIAVHRAVPVAVRPGLSRVEQPQAGALASAWGRQAGRPTASPPPAGFDPITWLLAAWAAVAAALLARLVVQAARTSRLTGTYPPLDDPGLRAELSAAAAHLGLRRLPLAVVAPAGTGPAVAGLFRPRLLLPADVADRLPRHARRLVLLHELAHVRRRDVPVGWLASAVAAVHWFNRPPGSPCRSYGWSASWPPTPPSSTPPANGRPTATPSSAWSAPA